MTHQFPTKGKKPIFNPNANQDYSNGNLNYQSEVKNHFRKRRQRIFDVYRDKNKERASGNISIKVLYLAHA